MAEDNGTAVCKTYSARISRGGNKTSSFNNKFHSLPEKAEAILKEYETAAVAASGAKAKTTKRHGCPHSTGV